VLIKVMASPINPSDQIFLRGANPNARQLPSVPGFEGSGMVIGSGGGELADALVGKKTAFRARPDKDGAWAQYTVTDAERCIPLLPAVSFIEGAMLLVNPLTAWTLVNSAQEAGHKCAIQNAAASALGRMVVKFAAERGLEMINIVRKKEQMELLQGLGAKCILNSEDAGFQDALRKATHECNATVAFDAIAGDAANQLLAAMPRAAELWSYGGLSEQPLKIDPMILIYEQKVVKGFWGPPTFYKLPEKKFAAASLEIQERLSTTFNTTVHKTFALAEFATALSTYESNMSRGKVLFLVGDPAGE
jgi:NADPH:quinone reductase-like Zn-dependent oxidoreductase